MKMFIKEKGKGLLFKLLKITKKRYFKGKGYVKYNPRLTHLLFAKNSQIQLNGNLLIGVNSFGNNRRSNIIRLDRDATISVKGDFSFMYGADINVFCGGSLNLGRNSYINSDCKLRCHKKITIGEECKISHDFTIMDSDVHIIDDKENTKEVVIGNHVWIATRVTILSGTIIGEGCVIAAGAVVRGVFPANSLIGGVPARILRSNIKWE